MQIQEECVFIASDLGSRDLKWYRFQVVEIEIRVARRAFDHYRLGNCLKKESLGSDLISTGIELGRIRRIFKPELFNRLGSAGVESDLPVFIVGMPRSGTSLVEQICASHSGV